MYPLWGLLLSFPLWTVSCVDNKYDLDKDIDMTINVGGEHLTIPAGSSDTAYLSKIIEVEEGDILQPDAATRVYHLTKRDDIDVDPTTVKEVTISSANTDLKQELVGSDDGGSGSKTTELDVKNNLRAEASDIDEALIELGALGAKTPTSLTLAFEFLNTGNLTFGSVTAKNLEIQLPDFLMFEKGEVEEGNKLILNNEELKNAQKVLHVIGYQFGGKAGEGEIPDKNRTITINGLVTMQGQVVTSGINGSGSLTMTLDVTLEEMTANSVTGVIQPEIKAETTNIELNDLPDFLKDEETRMDITNPVILLRAENQLETPVEVDAVLTPMKGNAQIDGKEVKVGSGYGKTPVVLASGKNVIALSRTGECTIEGVTSNVKVEDINDLLETIPDDIEVDLQPVVRNEGYYTAELGRAYEMPSSYEVDVPLSFEQNLNIVYNDSVQDLNKDLNDLDKVILKKANVLLTVDNAIPLKLQLKPENVLIKDVYGNELTAVKKTIEEDKQYVTESTDGEKPVTSELVLNLTSEDTAFLSKIDRICFKLTAVPGSATGVPLKDTQWLKVTSIKLSVPGGVNVDLN
ncbi:hypothetical protein [Phocaeicola plebeius]|jgi:hypothetical protein|uniref:Uncharacterized protein n=5 Tax=Phocaeicola plebeius TaxID=310297 RepID=A0A3E4N5N4_9BACT|nr:hypothetical protein [Phocaeicola plebeius]RGK57515.1 hypothetical protein DXD04_03230 [Phocaeicola plebeius]RGQ75786.1 hypothetical protein DWY86_00150 [Phocaeicola plebeius]RHJ67322.1 hypothetical protein DW110_03430 [Phocaeicola plebeius]